MRQPAATLLAMDASHTPVTTPGKQQQLPYVTNHNNSEHL